jgi:glycosyltransferase involved in cell wall biosynthesis
VDKVIIIVPAITAKGGISNYYQIMENYFLDNVIYMYRGARNYPYKSGFLSELKRLVKDYSIYFRYLMNPEVKLIQTTTALGRNAVLRDAIFIILAKIMKKKTIVFYRGWDMLYEKKVSRSKIFNNIFLKVDASIVLSQYQKKWLEEREAGNIYIGTTVVDDQMLELINPESIIKKLSDISQRKIKLIFLARLEKAKGIFELIDAFIKLNESGRFELIIVGSGTVEDEVKMLALNLKLNNIEFKGFLTGKDKINSFEISDIYIFPSYTEGMPNSVLEAMAMGLPVLTTKVGGLVDFFEEGKNGLYIEKFSSESIVSKINQLAENLDNILEMALYNHKYAIDNFLASNVAKGNEEIFEQVINKE